MLWVVGELEGPKAGFDPRALEDLEDRLEPQSLLSGRRRVGLFRALSDGADRVHISDCEAALVAFDDDLGGSNRELDEGYTAEPNVIGWLCVSVIGVLDHLVDESKSRAVKLGISGKRRLVADCSLDLAAYCWMAAPNSL